MTGVDRRVLREEVVAGKRLGRHLNHDPRNRDFPAKQAVKLQSVKHRVFGPRLNQGQLGGCPGWSAATACNAAPTRKAGVILHDADALAIYELATRLDSFAGEYPPIDTGSDGGSAGKAAVQLGHITSYLWAFGIDQALAAAVLRPVITGTEWPDAWDHPSSAGKVALTPGWRSRGGHEWCVTGVDFTGARTPLDGEGRCHQTWGEDFANHGVFYFAIREWATLLERGGDVTQLVR